MASMTSTMQVARSAVPARIASRSCPAAAQPAMFGSRLAIRPAAVQVNRFRTRSKRTHWPAGAANHRDAAFSGVILHRRTSAGVCLLDTSHHGG